MIFFVNQPENPYRYGDAVTILSNFKFHSLKCSYCIFRLGGRGGDGNSKGVGKNSVMTPYDYIVRAYLANVKNEIDLGAKCTTGQGEIVEWRNSRMALY